MGSSPKDILQTTETIFKSFQTKSTMLLRNCFSGILLVVVLNVNLTQGAKSFGPCENASRGETFHKCTMECNFDGSCDEVVSSETCDCDGSAVFLTVTNSYQDGQTGLAPFVVGKRRRKRQSDDVCNNMSSRCRSCRGGSGGTAQAVKTENNKFCSGNGGSGNRRVINGGFNGGSNGGSFGGSGSRNGGSGGCTRYTDCKGDRICDNQQCHSPGNGGSFGGNGGSFGGNGGSFGGNNNGGIIGSNGGSFGGGRSPSCGKKRVSGFTQGGCIYECDGDITGSGTCATESNGTCGSCFGSDWSGGSCTGEPRQCTSCKSVCRNRGK